MAEGLEKEKKQLIVFLKYFALKSAQVIVQSRDGVKIVARNQNVLTKDDKNQHDWFNLAIPDNENVSLVTKDALNGETVSALKQMLCIDIYLKFNEGDDELLLETWTLSLSPDKDLSRMCPMGEVYHRMGTLLKSLLTLSRIPPAYKLARKQKTEPYTLSYRIYCGDPHIDRLGVEVKNIKVGSLVISIGTISLLVSYRTNLTITPSKKPKSTENKDDIMVKSDHFKDSPKKEVTDKKVPDLNKPLSAGAFVDTNKIEELHKALQENLPPEPPMSWLLYQIKDSPDEQPNQSTLSSQKTDSVAADEPSVATRSKAIEVPTGKKSSTDEYTFHRKLEFPFADGSPITELANFYHDCLTARSQSEEWCDVAEEIKKLSTDSESLSHQFKVFQDAVPEFDSMVASMFSNSSENDS